VLRENSTGTCSYTYHIRGWLTDINKVGVGTDLEQLAACDTIPPGDPIPNLFGEDEDSEEEVYSLQDTCIIRMT
jgi:hypothetical protein